MHPVPRLSILDQITEHLRKGVRQGRWRGAMPGVRELAADLNAGRNTVQAALRQLAEEKVLRARGQGRSRAIIQPRAARHSLRAGILLYEALSVEQPLATQVLFQIRHELEMAGHEVFFAAQTQQELQHDLRRIARHVGENPADAWIVVSSPRALLRWFSRQKTPCFALFGRSAGLAIAGVAVDKVRAFIAATRQLLALGHRRIVCIARRPRTKAVPGKAERAFLEELDAHGIVTGEHRYCLPGWEETPAGFDALLESLFRLTPPTALIVDEIPLVFVVMQFLARRGIKVPGQVSLMATDNDPAFAWGHPPFAHIRWDSAPIVRRVVRWVAAVRRGRAGRKTVNFPAEFVPSGSIGPAPGR
jgi:DNA-binding LacI/PurR family transcriptional regulator